jgi:CRP-like cAMP-binding protein
MMRSPPTTRKPGQRPASRRHPTAASELSNDLLATLPPDAQSRVLNVIDVVRLPLKEFLHRPGDTIKHVYFPGGGFCSELAVLESGEMVEIATIGREGVVGAFAADPGGIAQSAAMVQAECDRCYRMKAEMFRSEMERRGAFYELVTRYRGAHIAFIMQSTACNAVHTVEQRLSRWLLMAQDRIAATEFPLTQEFLAMMLGAARPTVTIVAGTLQKAGLITYRRGWVTVVDREKLEAASCECYRVGTNLLRAVTQDAAPRRR